MSTKKLDVKAELNSTSKDFATLDAPCDVTSQQICNPIKKTKVTD